MATESSRNHRRLAAAFGASLGALVWAGLAPLAAQPSPAPPAAPADPAFEAARAAFEALTPAERKAVQDALVWTGDHSGVVDGEFGRRTRDAFLAFDKRLSPSADGVATPAKLKTLLAAGRKAREAVRFAVVTDVTGAKIGVPQALLAQAAATKTSARYASRDGAVTLDTALLSGVDIDLPQMFDRLKSESPTRKVAYKLQRPDFVVVSGQTQNRKFYTRFARGLDASGQPVLRGLTFSTPLDRPDLDRLTIAVANAFDPFPGAAPAAVAGGQSGAGAGAGAGAGMGAGAASGMGVNVAPPPIERATAIAVAPRRALAVLPKGCAAPTLAGRPARIVAAQTESGLALLESDGAGAPLTAAPAAPTSGMDVVAVGFAAGEGGRAALAVASGVIGPGAGGAMTLSAGLQPGMSGAAVLDREGRLVGLARLTPPRQLVAGVVPLAAHGLAPAPAALDFAVAAGAARPAPVEAATSRRSAADLAELARKSLGVVACGG